MADALDPPLNAPAPSRTHPLQEAFGRLSNRNRLALLIGLPLLIAIVAATLLWTREPAYRVLFSGLSDTDGGAILTALQTQKIPYKMTDNGSAILVPPERVHEIRLGLASQGLPRAGNVGFELMDNSRMGLTQFQEQINYQRALEGELSRSIQSLGSVRSARVHLAIPKPSIFIREQNRPTASVLVQVYPGRVLERAQVAGIVHLVSSSVPEMATSAVSVVDQTGALLSSGEMTGSGLDSSQMEYLRAMEQQYTRRISDLLTPIVGAQNVRAQVAIDLDFSRAEQTDEIYKPNSDATQAAIRSRQSSESRDPAALNPGGVPGSLSNTPPGVATAPITGNAATNPPATPASTTGVPAESVKRADTTNYEVDKTVRYVREPVGRIRRISTAVVVNHRNSTVNGATVPAALSVEELAQIKALVNDAVGFSSDRRDSVSVINIPFNDSAIEKPEEVAFWQQSEVIGLAREIGIGLIVAIAVLYLILGVIRPAVRQMTAPPPPPEPVVPNYGLNLPPDGSASGEEESPEDPLERVRRFARDNPQVVANVIRQWVNDPQSAP